MSSSSRKVQNALILNLVIFLAGAITHNVALGDFSYSTFLIDKIDYYTLVGLQDYFALTNSSAIITGTLVVFAYALLYSFAKFVGERIMPPRQLVVKVKYAR
ncbi:MAG: hypothetical protein ACRD38_06310 [Nitrososphaerales archaeon]